MQARSIASSTVYEFSGHRRVRNKKKETLLKPKISPGKAVSCEMLLQSAVACDITDLDNRRLVVELIASGIPVAKIPSNAQRDDRNLSLASFIALLLISRLQN